MWTGTANQRLLRCECCLIVMWSMTHPRLLSGTVCSSLSLWKQQTRLQKPQRAVQTVAQVAWTNPKAKCLFEVSLSMPNLKETFKTVSADGKTLDWRFQIVDMASITSLRFSISVLFVSLSHSTFSCVSFSPSFPYPLLTTLIVTPHLPFPSLPTPPSV